ncbi:MAG: sialidase [Gammaproteobacteria bacterium]|nr:sialidase [Gammaproteobacteria bacterium]
MNRTIANAALAAAFTVICGAAGAAGRPAPFDYGTISGLGARNIGAAVTGGRIAALAARDDRSGKTTLFVGAADGGVWKSTDGGTTFKPVFDDQPVASIGAIAIDPTHPNNVWVGTGESWTRNTVSIGNGIYKSTDDGETWTHVGLDNSERISRILVDPRDSDVVYACVPGKLWSDSAERGLYKTTDGGNSWTQILKGSNLSTGCSTLALDPKNPEVLLAGLWDFRRKGWTFRSGGDGPQAFSGSGLFESRDAGATWTEITPATNKGFPAKPYGRLAVAIAPTDPNRVYAFVESPHSALYVSDDGGATWQQRDKSQWMVWRPFYFASLIVDPNDANRVFKTDGNLIVSNDAGRSFSVIAGFQTTHGDLHAVWIDPKNSRHVIAGDDGGLWLSYDGGNKWWKGGNLPISQFYHVSVDNDDPYHVYGGLQDNSDWVGDSAYPGGITNSRWENMYGGDGFWMFEDPADPDYLYAEAQGGTIGRVNRHTHETRDIQPQAGYKEKLRWNWNTPIALSPNDKGTVYIGAQFLFRSRDHGDSWQRISPDLTTNNPQWQQQERSGGVTVDNSAAEAYTTIYSISESPQQAGLIWVGTDDGNLQLTRDGGAHWENLIRNVRGLPQQSWVNWVQASRFDAGTAYAAFDRHSFGEMGPYLYKTTDYGRTWTPLLTPRAPKGVRGYAWVIKEDTVKPDLLFLGTELGLWVSIDGGERWAQFKGGHLPDVAVRDLAIQPRDDDLVIATHGRGIWIVDDITPLRHLTPAVLDSHVAFVAARPQQQRIEANGGWSNGDAVFVGQNPPAGAVITYYRRTRHLFGKLKLEVLDDRGEVIDTLPASARRGLNRVVWSMHLPPPRAPPAVQLAFNGAQGPRVLPGTYTIRMTDNGKVYETHIEVSADRRDKFTLADRKAQFEAAMRVHALFGRESDLVDRVGRLRAGIAQRLAAAGAGSALGAKLHALDAKADAVRKLIVATKQGGAITGELRLREYTDALYGALLSYEGRPGDYQLARIDALQHELDDATARFDRLLSSDLPALNDALKAGKFPPLSAPPTPGTGGGRPAAGSGRPATMRQELGAAFAPMLPADYRFEVR